MKHAYPPPPLPLVQYSGRTVCTVNVHFIKLARGKTSYMTKSLKYNVLGQNVLCTERLITKRLTAKRHAGKRASKIKP